ncbi:MAG TPA: FtsX-like permease family protein [Prolixibacteraceae bacterium]|nr:FtsX-like permease family protein [Prolixibacteraceae bacterium]
MKIKDVLKIAWRNLWRNKRRTLITAASIFFAVFFAIFMRSFQLGTYGYMIEQSIESYTGYLQVQNPEYADDPSIDHSLALNPNVLRPVREHPNVEAVSPRIESFALISSGILSKGIMISGIDPLLEEGVSNPAQRLVRYQISKDAIARLKEERNLPASLFARLDSLSDQVYSNEKQLAADLELEESSEYLPTIQRYISLSHRFLTPGDSGVVISYRLARYLKVTAGDSIVLMGQGYQGISAAGVYPVRGLVRMASPELDNKLVYMDLGEARKFFSLNDRVSYLAINLNEPSEMVETQKDLQETLGFDQLVVKNWEEILPTLKQQIEGDNVSGKVFIGILYAIVFFGIFGTVVMMIAERRREFGVMIAVGMKRRKLSLIVSVEMLLLGIVGTLSGMLASVPVLLYGHYSPIHLTGEMARMYEEMGFDPLMPLALFEPYFFIQGAVVLSMILLVCLSPVQSIQKLDEIRAIRG